MNLFILSASSLVWGALLWGGGLLAQRYGEANGAARQVVWRLAALMLIAPWIIAPVGVLMGLRGPAPAPVVFAPQAEAPMAWGGGEGEVMPTSIPAVAPISIPWETVLLLALAAGWAWRVFAAQRARRTLGRIVGEARTAGEGPEAAALRRWSARLGLRRAPQLKVVDTALSPFSYGVVRPVVVLPRDLANKLTPGAIDLVIGHECLHVARGDGWLRPLERIVADLLWFNPFAWMIRRELDFARELACDEAVLAHAGESQTYARTLRDVASLAAGLSPATPATAMSLAGGGQAMVKRVRGAIQYAGRRPTWSALVAAGGLALVSAPVAFAQAVLAAPPPPPEVIAPPAPPAPPAVAGRQVAPAAPLVAQLEPKLAHLAPPAPRPAPAPQPVPQVPPAPQVAPAPQVSPVPAVPAAPPAPDLPRHPKPIGWATAPVLAPEAHITSPFGRRLDPLSGKPGAMHEGVDLGAPLGALIRSPGAGQVTFAGEKPGYANVVEVAYPDGTRLRYAHLKDIGVKAGDAVQAGQTLGTVGTDAQSTGPHLHLEVVQNGVTQDPEKIAGLTLVGK